VIDPREGLVSGMAHLERSLREQALWLARPNLYPSPLATRFVFLGLTAPRKWSIMLLCETRLRDV
jgi:hypothetical protein